MQIKNKFKLGIVMLSGKFLSRISLVSLLCLMALNNIGCTTSDSNDMADSSVGHYGAKNLASSAKYNVQLGLGYLEQGDVERAKDKFLRAIKQAPKMPEVNYNLAHFYYLISEFDLAEQYFEYAVSYASNSTTGVLGTSHNNYGVFLCQTKKYAEANNHFLQAAADSTYADTASAYENAGLCALKAENRQLAKTYFDKAVSHNPLAPKALIELSQLNFDEKNYTQAKFYLGRYNQLVGQNKRSLLLGWQMAQAEGDAKELKQLTSILLEKYPEVKLDLQTQKISTNNDFSSYASELGFVFNRT